MTIESFHFQHLFDAYAELDFALGPHVLIADIMLSTGYQVRSDVHAGTLPSCVGEIDSSVVFQKIFVETIPTSTKKHLTRMNSEQALSLLFNDTKEVSSSASSSNIMRSSDVVDVCSKSSESHEHPPSNSNINNSQSVRVLQKLNSDEAIARYGGGTLMTIASQLFFWRLRNEKNSK